MVWQILWSLVSWGIFIYLVACAWPTVRGHLGALRRKIGRGGGGKYRAGRKSGKAGVL